MFENEQQYTIKTADDIRKIQEGFVQMNPVSSSVMVSDSQNESIDHFITNEYTTKMPLWGIYMLFGILTMTSFNEGMRGIIIWCLLFIVVSLFGVFTKGESSEMKKIQINWLRLYIIFGYFLMPISFLYEPLWFGFPLWLIISAACFSVWVVVTFRVEKNVRYYIDTFKFGVQDLQQFHSSAIFDMSLDFYSPTIYPQQVIKIRDSIERVTAQIQQLLELQHRISNYYQRWFATFWSVFFSKKLKEQMQSFFRNESNQLLIYVNTFSQDLNFWTERHKMELSQLEENIDQQREETILPEGKLSLELSQDRISRLTQEADMIRVAQK
ncbi:MAG: hypothetical protein U0518_04135 [Candidatus Gracilibacteria bacterium]